MTEETPRPEALFFDGETAVGHKVLLSAEDGNLVFSGADGTELARWKAADMRLVRGRADRSDMAYRLKDGSPARLVIERHSTRTFIATHARRLRRWSGPRHPFRLLALAAGAVGSVSLILFVLLPAMAGMLAKMMPREAEVALGEATLEQIRQAFASPFADTMEECRTSAGTAALEKMVASLSDGTEVEGQTRTLVLYSDMVNAFALPGGIIVVMSGLIWETETPEELAAVLAHEIGHVVARDPTREALRSAGSIGVLGLVFGDFAGGGMTLVLMNQLINADYTQQAEARADAFALQQMRKAGIDPKALASLFTRLRDQYGDVKGIVAHFASHPELGDRIAAANAAPVPDQITPILTEEEWIDLQDICN